VKEEYFFESADAGCAGRMLETAKKYVQLSWLNLELRSKKGIGGGYDVIGFWNDQNGIPQAGPKARFEEEVLIVRAFAAGFRAGMGSR